MSIFQRLTYATIGIAIVIAATGIGNAVLSIFGAATTFSVTNKSNQVVFLNPYLQIILSLVIAWGVVAVQQSVMGYFVQREMDKIQATFMEIETALGTEKALEWVEWRTSQVMGKIDLNQSQTLFFSDEDQLLIEKYQTKKEI